MIAAAAHRPRRAEPQGVPRRPRRRHPPPPAASRSACRPGPRSACSASPGPAPRPPGRTYVVPDDIKALAEPGARPPPPASPPRRSSGHLAAADVARRGPPRTVPVADAVAHRLERRPMLTRQGWLPSPAAPSRCSSSAACSACSSSTSLGAAVGALVLVVARRSCALTRLRARRSAASSHPPRVHAGTPEPGRARASRNQGAPPHARCSACATRCRAPAAPTCSSAPLDPGESAAAAYRLPTERRGILEIGPLDGRRRRPVRPRRGVDDRRGAVAELTVYPHVDDDRRRSRRPPATTRSPGAEHPNALGRRGEDFYALRPYVVGDDLRRVHWPSTARHDELMVRQDELPWQGRATVLLDVRRAAHTPTSRSSSRLGRGQHRHGALAPAQDLVRLVTTDGTDSGLRRRPRARRGDHGAPRDRVAERHRVDAARSSSRWRAPLAAAALSSSWSRTCRPRRWMRFVRLRRRFVVRDRRRVR